MTIPTTTEPLACPTDEARDECVLAAVQAGHRPSVIAEILDVPAEEIADLLALHLVEALAEIAANDRT
ncbi:hypothetical protein DSD19_04600 [Rhodovulum sp. BSW8]|uniref:hypothetical protein n=1 Tax=Rhodovulum sp. BSW8 TaxID=2259645 RepID=UPI000DE293B5|nr:hypothetical protein [Rhodovulum sp. BSW8]RBO54660.1 hypothetical protein DSD19_04600 [Rhodovulum sp. BSW8]